MTDTKLQELEQKVARLEADIRELRGLISDGTSKPWWERTAGMFKNDPVWAEIVRLGQKIRREELTMEFRETRKNPRGKRSKNNHGPRQIQKRKR